MHRIRRKRREADRHILGAVRFRSTVADPFPCGCHNRLSGAHVEGAAFVLDTQRASENDRDLLELGSLARFLPSAGGDHPRDADAGMACVYATGVLLNTLGLGSNRLNDRRCGDELRHGGDYVRCRPPLAEGASHLWRKVPATFDGRCQPRLTEGVGRLWRKVPATSTCAAELEGTVEEPLLVRNVQEEEASHES
jgi:hypothetical protein